MEQTAIALKARYQRRVVSQENWTRGKTAQESVLSTKSLIRTNLETMFARKYWDLNSSTIR